jgi:hypothetical protein
MPLCLYRSVSVTLRKQELLAAVHLISIHNNSSMRRDGMNGEIIDNELPLPEEPRAFGAAMMIAIGFLPIRERNM